MSRGGALARCLVIASALPAPVAGQPPAGLEGLTPAPATLPAGCALVPAASESDDDGTGQAFARIRKGRVAALVVGDRGPCLAALERHLRAAVSTSEAAPTKRPVSLLIDLSHLHDARARGEKGDAAIEAAIAALEADAKKVLALAPMSMMDESITPPSGDRHDYVSQAPYWWPDPAKPDGKPHIRKDGLRNPAIGTITDRDNLGRLGDAVATLGLACAYKALADRVGGGSPRLLLTVP